MINDSSISDIIKDWKKNLHEKLKHDQRDMKNKVHTQFKKISKEELLNQTIIEVYSIMLFDKKSSPLYLISSHPRLDDDIHGYLKDNLSHFYEETSVVNEDGFNLMTYLEFLMNNYDENSIFWCSYPQISYDIMEEADTYYFYLIRYNKERYINNLYVNNQPHPFIKSLNYTWISQYKEKSYDNAFRKSAANMNDLLNNIWDDINLLSTMKYEGSSNVGSLLFMSDHEPELLLNLENPVPLSNYRIVRKLLQMSRPQHYLLIDCNYMAVGFGYIKSEDPLYRIDFLDHLSWKMYYGNDEFLSCNDLLPVLPSRGSNVKKLKDQLSITFKSLDYNEELLVEIIEEAKFQRKGTMIVITKKAKEEALRLKTSSIKIKPIQLTKGQIKMVTGIDGALILSTDGYCHSIGTILDGSATDTGDASRGARFNSAIRYLNSQIKSSNPCLIAVVSEDRYVDILSTGSFK